MKIFYVLGLSVVLFSSGTRITLGQTTTGTKPNKKSSTSTPRTRLSASDVEHLLARVTAIEDRLEIQNLLAGSAFSSDVASEAYWTNMFTADAVMDRGNGRPLDRGRDVILKVVGGPDQREAIKSGMTHLAMLPHITLLGDSAVATGSLLIVMPDTAASHVKLPGKGVSPGFSIYQLTFNRWELIRTASGWKVTRRTVRPMTGTDSRQILVQAIEGAK